MSNHQAEPATYQAPHVESPYAGKRLSVREQLAIASFWFGSNFLWGSMLAIVVPAEVARIAPQQKAQLVGVLGGVAAFVALVVPLLAGALSDRCASRFGRRRPYMVAGTAINVLGLALMFFAAESRIFVFFLAAYCIVQLGNNIATAPYSGMIPDLVPENQRGVASGYMALMTQIGTLAGAVITGQLVQDKMFGATYLVIGGVLVLFMSFTVLGVRENPLPEKPPPLRPIPYLKSLWISPKLYPDFAWVWVTRALVMMGFYAVQPFAQYYLADVIRVPNPAEAVGVFIGIVLIGATVSAYVGGVISDRVGRKKVVYVANSIIAAMSLALIFCRTYEQVVVVGILFGIGYGAYISVDWALGTDVLPSKKDAAKDMAVWHVSMVLPQSLSQPVAGYLLAAFGATVAFDPTTREAVYHYTIPGYTALFLLASACFVLGAVLLRNVKKAR